jgi:hypothetical protein
VHDRGEICAQGPLKSLEGRFAAEVAPEDRYGRSKVDSRLKLRPETRKPLDRADQGPM